MSNISRSSIQTLVANQYNIVIKEEPILKYRSDIDGLRAVAVLAVLFYHAGFSGFEGGYIGVDIFFVISGFLITKKITSDIFSRAFSLMVFYEKRIRRIFPALIVVVIFSVTVGIFIYDENTSLSLIRSGISTNLFLSNFYFYFQDGYFAAPSALKPLLHMWSLSVEEQFYLFFPLLLIVLGRLSIWVSLKVSSDQNKVRKTLENDINDEVAENQLIEKEVVYFLLLILVIPLFFNSISNLNLDPNAGFYLAHLRAWEFVIGGIVALSAIRFGSKLGNFLSLAGLFLIVYSIFTFSESTHFPGYAALLPVIGTALIIQSGAHVKTYVGWLLSNKLFTFIGKISYSLYLWHWPIFVFGRYFIVREASLFEISLLIFSSFSFAFISWKFVETPFRDTRYLKQSQIFITVAILLFISLIIGSTSLSGEFLYSFDQNGVAEKENIYEWDLEKYTWRECDFRNLKQTDRGFCHLGDETVSPSFLVWGDSHAGALASGINLAARDANSYGYLVSNSGCPPLMGVINNNVNQERCPNKNEIVLDFIKSHPEIVDVVLVARWPLYSEGKYYKGEDGNSFTLTDIFEASQEELSNQIVFETGLLRTINNLLGLGLQVTIVSTIPEIGYIVSAATYISEKTARDANSLIAPTYQEFLSRNEFVHTTFELIALSSTSVQIVRPEQVLCNSEICLVAIDGIPLYRDEDHLSTFGSQHLRPLYVPIFESVEDQ